MFAAVQPIQTIKITNKKYFNMIDNQVRGRFAAFEITDLLPKAEKVLELSKITFKELKDYPVEGYYYKDEALRKYFKIIRNFQENEDIFERIAVNSDEFEYLKDITDRELFGKWDSGRRAAMGQKASPMPRRFDILAQCMQGGTFDPDSTRPWSIKGIMNALESCYTGTPNLVELAYLTKDVECLACSAETNSLYRDFAYMSGCMSVQPIIEYLWEVDPEVEDLGRRTVEEYNKILDDERRLVIPSLANHISLDNETEKPRVARLGYVGATQEWYYWIVPYKGAVTEEYTRMEKTTETESGLLKTSDVPNFFKAYGEGGSGAGGTT